MFIKIYKITNNHLSYLIFNFPISNSEIQYYRENELLNLLKATQKFKFFIFLVINILKFCELLSKKDTSFVSGL